MALDPTIPLGVQPPAPANPMAWVALAQQRQDQQALEQERQAQAQKIRDQQAQQAAIQQAMHDAVDPATGTVNTDTAVKKLQSIGQYQAADALQKQADASLKSARDSAKVELENRGTELDQLMQKGRAVATVGATDPAAWQSFVTDVAKSQILGPQIAAGMPTKFDPNFMAQALAWGDTQKDAIDRIGKLNDALEKAPTTAKGWVDLGAQQLSVPMSPDEQNNTLGVLEAHGMPKDIAQMFVGKTPDQIRQMGLTAEQKTTASTAASAQAGEAQRAQTTAGLEQQRIAIEKQRLDLTAKNQDVTDLAPFINTTAAGRQYINLGDFQTPNQKKQAQDLANAKGISYVDAKADAGLKAADAVKSTLGTIQQQIQDKLPKDAQGRIIGGAANKLSQLFQTQPELAAFGAWRTAAIQTVQALAQPGMGLRINQAEINAAMNNDLPQITDTVATAQQRLKNLETMLESKESSTLTRNRQEGSGGGVTPPPGAKVEKWVIDPATGKLVKGGG